LTGYVSPAAHHSRRHSKEMCAISPSAAFDPISRTQISFTRAVGYKVWPGTSLLSVTAFNDFLYAPWRNPITAAFFYLHKKYFLPHDAFRRLFLHSHMEALVSASIKRKGSNEKGPRQLL
jgi:hypothetical protein